MKPYLATCRRPSFDYLDHLKNLIQIFGERSFVIRAITKMQMSKSVYIKGGK